MPEESQFLRRAMSAFPRAKKTLTISTEIGLYDVVRPLALYNPQQYPLTYERIDPRLLIESAPRPAPTAGWGPHTLNAGASVTLPAGILVSITLPRSDKATSSDYWDVPGTGVCVVDPAPAVWPAAGPLG